MTPIYFGSPAAFRTWLEQNHTQTEPLIVGYFKKKTGQPSLTWSESVDEALCFGWIDGVRRTVDADRYTVRFTPRKVGSVWSTINVAKVQALLDQGRMQPAGLKAFEHRQAHRSGIYSHEQKDVELPEPYLGVLQADATAWSFFESQSASYRKAVSWWVTSAKQEKTRLTRLAKLVASSANAERVPQFTSNPPGGANR